MRLLLISTMLIAGCGDGPQGGGLRAELDLTSLVGFVLAEGDGAPMARPSSGILPAEPTSGQTVYSIDASGLLSVTSFFDEGSSNTTSSQAWSVHNTPAFVVFGFNGLPVAAAGETTVCSALILSKDDGALFCMEAPILRPEGAVLANQDGNLIYFDQYGAGGLIQLDMTDRSARVAQEMLNAEMIYFAVNQQGDVLASFGEGGPRVRIFKVDGGLQNIDTSYTKCLFAGLVGEESNFYYLKQAGPGQAEDLYKLTRNSDGSFTSVLVGTFNDVNPTNDCNVVVRTTDRIIVSRSTPGNPPPELIEMVNPGMTFATHPLADITELVDARGADAAEAVFIQGTNAVGDGVILKWAVSSASQITVVPGGDLSITAIDLAPSGELSFTGRRNSDGNDILGAIGPTDTTYTITDDSAPVAFAMVRIN